MPNAVRDQVFVSYSHADRRWHDEFKTMIAPLVREDKLVFWSDQDIESGENWHVKITNAITQSRVALLLVSPYFLASKFIMNCELPIVIEQHEEEELSLCWVPVGES